MAEKIQLLYSSDGNGAGTGGKDLPVLPYGGSTSFVYYLYDLYIISMLFVSYGKWTLFVNILSYGGWTSFVKCWAEHCII